MQVSLSGLKKWSIDQINDSELKGIMSGTTKSALKLEPRSIAENTIYVDTSMKQARMYVSMQRRGVVLDGLHGQFHRDSNATSRLIRLRY